MGWRNILLRAGLVALLLLGAAACGDDDDSAGSGAGLDDGSNADESTEGGDIPDTSDDGADTGDTATGLGLGIDACSLLQPAEIEAQFAEVGPVGEGSNSEFGTEGCLWTAEAGETGVGGTDIPPPEFWLRVEPLVPDVPVDAALGDPIAVAGLGDEAYFEGDSIYSSLYVGTGELVLSVGAAILTQTVEGMQERMVALAELALGRL